MNKNEDRLTDEIIALKILDEIEEDSHITQRDLSKRLGIALGLVNTYIKHFVKKGYIRVTQFPQTRYTYLLTPTGISEKSRLVYKHISYYNNLFNTVRQDSLTLFKKLKKEGVREIAFCGVDEVAEISYLSLKEVGIKLLAVYDTEQKGKFLDYQIENINKIKSNINTRIYISSLKKKKEIYDSLISFGIKSDNISYLGTLAD